MESRTQIGEEAMQTPTFRAKIRTVVFNPDWTVPPTIIEKEIMEDMRSGKNVIDEKGLVITDRENHVVDPGSIDWGSADPAEFPYTIRQPAGDDNALGKVKFLFPNKYSIYLHDTPSRHLFEADRRTFSHGCIRLENPIEAGRAAAAGPGLVGSGEDRADDRERLHAQRGARPSAADPDRLLDGERRRLGRGALRRGHLPPRSSAARGNGRSPRGGAARADQVLTSGRDMTRWEHGVPSTLLDHDPSRENSPDS